jgi:hypothetical protein
MLSLLPGGRILVAVEAVDGRKGIDSLAGVVRSVPRRWYGPRPGPARLLIVPRT